MSNSNNSAPVYFEPDKVDQFPFSALVENYLGGVGQLIFGDGTFQFAENNTYPEVVYSPRLSEEDLEKFCEENIAHYETYFENHLDAINEGKNIPPIERFWETK
jgi:hypothetical protein